MSLTQQLGKELAIEFDDEGGTFRTNTCAHFLRLTNDQITKLHGAIEYRFKSQSPSATQPCVPIHTDYDGVKAFLRWCETADNGDLPTAFRMFIDLFRDIWAHDRSAFDCLEIHLNDNPKTKADRGEAR